ncbi:HupE/UreJ family protein [Thiobacter aerophilum]|uniref:HupE/UreJ family protein n=1 Tax=Thiobacter aerophilum TaxID=3121275 RepID=A0ABV0EHH5_9BURK
MATAPRRPLHKLGSTSLLLAASPALAHTDHAATGLVAGLLHPVTGWDHLLAMFAVGLWAAQPHQRSGAIWWLPASFMLALLAGAAWGWNGVTLPWGAAWVEPGIAASVLALGLLIALARCLPLTANLLLTAAFGAVHGYAHGLEWPQATSPAHYAMGFLLATAGLHVSGVALGYATRRHAWASRLTGGLIAASGVGLISPL